MKKNFPLSLPTKPNARVLEAIKQDIRKYVKRERRKPLPEGVDFWDFDCKVGAAGTDPAVKHLAEVIPAVDVVAALPEATGVYVEILAKPGHRTPKPVALSPDLAHPEPLAADANVALPPDQP